MEREIMIVRFRQNIACLCRYKGLTFSEVAQKIGMSQGSFSTMLRTGNPTLNRITDIAYALGVDISELLSPNIYQVIAKIEDLKPE